MFLWPSSDATRNDIRLGPYLPIFIMGILIAHFHVEHGTLLSTKLLSVISSVAAVIAASILIIMVPCVSYLYTGAFIYDKFHHEYFLYALLWSIVLLCAVSYYGLINKFFRLTFFRFFGALSFSLYLFHPVFIGVVNRLNLPPYLRIWAVLTFSVLAVFLSFKVIEASMSKLKFRNLFSI